MLALLASILISSALAVAFAAAIGGGGIGYPALVSGAALAFALYAVITTAMRILAADRAGLAALPRIGAGYAARVAAFGTIWLLYVLFLPTAGFLVASTLALILSLWVTSGRLGVLSILGPAVFVLSLAILVSVVLYVPVPKSPVDYALDEFVFALLGGGT